MNPTPQNSTPLPQPTSAVRSLKLNSVKSSEEGSEQTSKLSQKIAQRKASILERNKKSMIISEASASSLIH